MTGEGVAEAADDGTGNSRQLPAMQEERSEAAEPPSSGSGAQRTRLASSLARETDDTIRAAAHGRRGTGMAWAANLLKNGR